MLARRLAPWVVLGALGLLLLAPVAPSLSPASYQSGSPVERDIQLELGPYFFNPSIVAHRGVYLATARTAHMKRIDKTNWWFNEGYICMSTTPDFKSVSCRKFDPWQGRFQECLWGTEKSVPWVDTQGLEDPKLWVWPGKGVYAVFGRKPEALGASPYCRDPVFVQFFVQVVAENTTDEWSVHRPRELKPGAFAHDIWHGRYKPADDEPIKEKNWMPLIWEDQLYVIHSVYPHRVWRMNSSGYAVDEYLTADHGLFAPYKDQSVHGGPPVILVPAGATPTGQAYYLGIFHFFMTFGEGSEKIKVYHHFAYKVEAAPPFRVCAISQEIPLVMRKPQRRGAAADWKHQRIWKDTSQTAYIAGLHLEGERVLMSYGSSDIDARLLTLTLDEVEAMFDKPMDCSGSELLRLPEGFDMAAAAARALNASAAGAAAAAAASAAAGGGGFVGGAGALFGGEALRGRGQATRRRFAVRRQRRSHRRDNEGW